MCLALLDGRSGVAAAGIFDGHPLITSPLIFLNFAGSISLADLLGGRWGQRGVNHPHNQRPHNSHNTNAA
jgi:hypothetical protein